MRRKQKVTMMVILIGVLVFINIPIVSWVLDVLVQPQYYRYSNYSGAFTSYNSIEFKMTSHRGIQTRFKSYVLETSLPAEDKVLYRVFWRNPIYLWRWYTYFVDNRYDLPYMSWKDIKERRGFDAQFDPRPSEWQAF